MLSVTKLEKCPCCSSENIVKNGFTKGGNQRVLCYEIKKNAHLNGELMFIIPMNRFIAKVKI
jgi:transposase-like protein